MLNLFRTKKTALTPFRRTQMECLKKYKGQQPKEQPKRALGFFSHIERLITTAEYINQKRYT